MLARAGYQLKLSFAGALGSLLATKCDTRGFPGGGVQDECVYVCMCSVSQNSCSMPSGRGIQGMLKTEDIHKQSAEIMCPTCAENGYKCWRHLSYFCSACNHKLENGKFNVFSNTFLLVFGVSSHTDRHPDDRSLVQGLFCFSIIITWKQQGWSLLVNSLYLFLKSDRLFLLNHLSLMLVTPLGTAGI